jgi:glycosyltransferase involved in cell wall biosynthesis
MPAHRGTQDVNLLVVTHFFESHRGGIEIVAGRLVRELALLGMTVTWLATDSSSPPDPADIAGVNTVPISASNVTERLLGVPFPLPGVASLRRIWREVRRCDAVLVHDGLYVTSVMSFLSARLLGKPIVIVQHIGAVPYRSFVLRTLMRMANTVVARPLLARADRTVFISESTARYFNTILYRRPPELIFNGVDTSVFHPVRDTAEINGIRGNFELPRESRIILFVGRFVEKKGLPILERLARAHSQTTFVLAGWGQHDPRRWALPNVRVFDDLSGAGLARLYRACDLFALPSTGEGFPLVIQEALASGLPVICGEESAHADAAASHELTGIAIDPLDMDGTATRFAAAIEHELARPPCEAARARRFRLACERYSWRRVAARYERLLRSLAEAGGRASQHARADTAAADISR